MQNIRVANGHTKKLQRGCAKGQKKEQRRQNCKPTHCPGSNPRLPNHWCAALPLGLETLCSTSRQNLLLEQRQVGALCAYEAGKP